MADEIDRANDIAARDLSLAIHAARSGNEVKATGACLYCDEPLAPNVRFCDADCARDWERENELRKRQGAAGG